VLRRSWRLRIEDILEAIRMIRGYVAGLDEASFSRDRRTVDAILTNLEVIGEAARHVPADLRNRHPAIPWLDMADMRNVLSHEYFGVDLGLVWRTAVEDLPAIEPGLEALLKEDPGEG
jgi:uncharacterized protein with HEPN domain